VETGNDTDTDSGLPITEIVPAAEAPSTPALVSKPVTDEVTLEYYEGEPVFSLYISQPGNMTQDSVLLGDECMVQSNLYRSKQKVINGGCFGDLDDLFDNVLLTETSDDRAPASFQVFETSDPNMVTLKRFMGSKQCEVCSNNRCEANEYTLPINECFFWVAKTDLGANFFTVVSRTDPIPNITFTFFEDAFCKTPYGSTLTGGGTDMCVGAKKPSPGATYDEGYEFREVIPENASIDDPVESYDISRWIRGTECQEGIRSAFFGTAQQETVRVPMSKCTEWETADKRVFYVKTNLGGAE